MEVDIYEIFDTIRRKSEDTSEFADNIALLVEDTKKSKFAIKLIELFDKYCDDNSLCSDCGSPIEYKVGMNEPVEYQGQVVAEPIYIKFCSNCG